MEEALLICPLVGNKTLRMQGSVMPVVRYWPLRGWM